MDKRKVSWHEFNGLVAEIARQIAVSGWAPDVIVGVTRGGAVPAVMLSQFFKCRMVGLDVSLRDNQDTPWAQGPETNCWLPEDASNGCQILVVDDINDSGATINWIVNDWNSSTNGVGELWNKGIRIATVFDKPTSSSVISVDYVGEEIDADKVEQWIEFPYEAWWKL